VQPGGFDGWQILGVMLLSQTLAIGTTTYAFSLFLRPIGEELQIAPEVLGQGHSVFLLCTMILGPFVGVALDRTSIRRLVLIGAILFGAGFVGMAASPSVWVLAAVYWGVVSAGALLTGPFSANKLVANWFGRMRGRALGIASIGTSTGGMLLPPLCHWAISSFGWRGAMLGLAGIVLGVIAPAVAWAVSDRPADRGQRVDGDATTPQEPVATAVLERIPFAQIARRPEFWGIALAFGLPWAVISGLMAHFNLWAESAGFGGGTAAFLLALFSFSAIPGKLAFGFAAERLDARALTWLGLALQLGFLAVLRLHPSYGMLVGASVVFGLSLGGLLPMHGTLVAQCFGAGSFASAMGAMGPIMTPLMAAAVYVGGWLPRVTGSYDRLLEVFLTAQLVAILALAVVRKVQRS